MLDFNPQPLDVLRLRYEAAITEIVDIDAVAHGDAVRPGQLRKHVFDFDIGLRLIISRERRSTGEIGVHISASWHPGTMMHGALDATLQEFKSAAQAEAWFMKEAIARWQQLSMSTEQPTFIGVTEGKGIPHWFLSEARVPAVH